jgi:hypothetical protein
MVGCETVFRLTITSTAGGLVAYPGEGPFSYFGGDRVGLVAMPEVGYRFAEWTGDVDTIEDVFDAVTAITMEDHYEITANFARYISMVVGGGYHTVGLDPDGEVVAVGHDGFGQCGDVAAAMSRAGRTLPRSPQAGITR